jgi:hypothetical protein
MAARNKKNSLAASISDQSTRIQMFQWPQQGSQHDPVKQRALGLQMPIPQQPIHSLYRVLGVDLAGHESTKPRQIEPTSSK